MKNRDLDAIQLTITTGTSSSASAVKVSSSVSRKRGLHSSLNPIELIRRPRGSLLVK